jgi:hypothetical protein
LVLVWAWDAMRRKTVGCGWWVVAKGQFHIVMPGCRGVTKTDTVCGLLKRKDPA